MQMSQQQRNIFWISFWIFEIYIKSCAFSKKKFIVIDFVFPKLLTPKAWLNKCLKSLVSEAPLTSIMVSGAKNHWNPHHDTFIKFIDDCQGNWVRESLSYWHAKSWDCLLTHWLPMKYPVLIRKNLTIPIQMQLSQKQKVFSQFFRAFLKSRLNFEHYEKKNYSNRFSLSKL